MEDYRLDITVGKGQASRTRSIPLAKFTLVGATTKVGSLTGFLHRTHRGRMVTELAREHL